MRVAVIGAGLFGCTAALHLDRAGAEVHLFEKSGVLLNGATSRCYYRLHRGYHYPRSLETAKESLQSEASFRAEYGPAVIDGGVQIYAVANEGSRVSGEVFEHFLRYLRLPFVRVPKHELIRNCDDIFAVEEPRLDFNELAGLVTAKLAASGVELHAKELTPSRAAEFDFIVVAAYANTGGVLAKFGIEPPEYKFQVVERPAVLLPAGFDGSSIVVVDGPFCCVDPLGSTALHIVGHVVETVHATNVGTSAQVPTELRQYVNTINELPKGLSRFGRVIADGSKFVPGLAKAEHVTSTLTIRAVMPNVEATDARPTLVDRVSDKIIRVFSGKLGTAVTAAREVVRMLEPGLRSAA